MAITLKHVLIVAAGAGLPVLFAALDAAPVLSWATLSRALAGAATVAAAAAMRSFLPGPVAS